jgi:hypothetical protein
MTYARSGSSRDLAWSKRALFTAAALALFACARVHEPPSAGEPGRGGDAALAQVAGAAAKTGLLTTARKVIRSAELSLQVDSPSMAQTTLTAIAEQASGYVASSEREADADEGENKLARVRLVLRVPSDQLGATLAKIKRLGRGAESERIGSEDVSDEYVDLGARIDNQKRLEIELARLLTQAKTVESALQVHKELASVRTEIDRMEGRRQFLEKETDFAKISVTLSPYSPLVRASFGEVGVSLRRAAADSIALAVALVLGGIRLLAVAVPVFLLFGAPSWGVFRLLRRRRARARATLLA